MISLAELILQTCKSQFIINQMSTEDRCVGCHKFGGLTLKGGKMTCNYCGLSWYPQSSLKKSTGSKLLPKTGQTYGKFYQTQMNEIKVYVSAQVTQHEDVKGLVYHLKSRGKRIHIFSGCHSQQGYGNGNNTYLVQAYGFYAQDKYQLQDNTVTVTSFDFGKCPEMAEGSIGIMAYCFSAYGGIRCPKCLTHTVFEVQGKGHYLCQAPNCGWSGYGNSLGL